MIEMNQIYEVLDGYINLKTITPEADLNRDQGIYGDDFHEMIQIYQKTFNVDMSGYLWYFHTQEEGTSFSFGSTFFKAPYERVTYIPVTPFMLLEFAKKGYWDIAYPPHKLPKRRWDTIIDLVIAVVFVFLTVYYFIS